ncbi:MAG: recombinase family protein [Clostridia bacterium]|nr:recombinase family protein [Clostridia bacterium]
MRVVGYARLSRDEDKENYSSIISQCGIIHEYASEKDWIIDQIYIDDNVSGYTFDRPAFNEMLSAMEAGSVDVIIAKDLSRIGRHNAKTLLFIEKLKETNKRLILVEEGNGYDTNEDEDDIIGIKTWYNERYVKDISRKIRSSMRVKQRNGLLIMHESYGYRKDPKDWHRLVVDEEIAQVVKLIFELYLGGLGYRRISEILNEKGFPTPSMYWKQKLEEEGRVFKNSVSNKWEIYMISRIIKDDIYIGTLRCRKTYKPMMKGNAVKVDKDEQYVFENHHEPIIDKQDFELAQQVNQKRREVAYRGYSKYEYIFSGFVFCDDCGSYSIGRNIRRSPGQEYGYECGSYHKYGRKGCTSHAIPESKLLTYFKEHLIFMREEQEGFIKTIVMKEGKKGDPCLWKKLEKELSIANSEYKMILSQKVKDVLKEQNPGYRKIVEENYAQLEYEKKKRIREIIDKIDDMKKADSMYIHEKTKNALQYYDALIQGERPNRKILEAVLNRIRITRRKSLIFELKIDIDSICNDI